MSLLLIWLSVAQAERPLPDYTNEVVIAAWFEVDRAISDACVWSEAGPDAGLPPLSCNVERLDKAIEVAESFIAHVRDDGRMHYLIALAHRHAGRLKKAEASLERAVKLAPDRSEAWRELGELRTMRGAHAEAEKAFAEVTRLLPGVWVGWFQRAQAHGHLGDAAAFEGHLLTALKYGFSFRLVEGNPAWTAFANDPKLSRTLERLAGVYGEPGLLERLRAPETP